MPSRVYNKKVCEEAKCGEIADFWSITTKKDQINFIITREICNFASPKR